MSTQQLTTAVERACAMFHVQVFGEVIKKDDKTVWPPNFVGRSNDVSVTFLKVPGKPIALTPKFEDSNLLEFYVHRRLKILSDFQSDSDFLDEWDVFTEPLSTDPQREFTTHGKMQIGTSRSVYGWYAKQEWVFVRLVEEIGEKKGNHYFRVARIRCPHCGEIITLNNILDEEASGWTCKDCWTDPMFAWATQPVPTQAEIEEADAGYSKLPGAAEDARTSMAAARKGEGNV